MPNSPKSGTARFSFATWIITLGGFLFGYDTGIINGALPFLQEDFRLSPSIEGLVTGSLTLGAALGAVTVGQLVDRFGRRRVLFTLALIFIIGSLGIGLAHNIALLVACRIIVGLAVGAASAVVPLYLAELAPPEKRGAIVTRNQFMIVTGQLLSYAVNAALGTIFLQNIGIWRIMFLLSIIPAALLFIGMFAVPESPRWLLMVGRFEQAQVAGERLGVDLTNTNEESQDTGNLATILRSSILRKTLIIAAIIGIVQQITGVNALMYYGTQVLRESGFNTDAALTANISNGAISVIGAALGLWIVGKLPRRYLLIIGLIGTTSSLLVLALISLFISGNAKPWLVLIVSIIFLIFQQGSVSPVTWLLMSEIFPARIRGAGMGTATFVSWLANFAVSFGFPQIVAALGLGATFSIFATLGIAAIAFTRFLIPETAQKKL